MVEESTGHKLVKVDLFSERGEIILPPLKVYQQALDTHTYNEHTYNAHNVYSVSLFVLRFYGPVNPVGSCRARSVYLTTRLLGRLSPLSG